MKVETSHEIVIESLTLALIDLMKTKPFDKITISELCEKACVGRVSFYRNFNSKQEILVKFLVACTDEWWQEFSQKPEEEFFANFWQSLLNEYKKQKELLLLLNQNDLTYLLRDHVFYCCGPSSNDDDRMAYLRALLAGMISGLIEEWVHRGMNDLPDALNIHALLQETSMLHKQSIETNSQ